MFQKFGLAFTCKTYVIYFQIKIWILHTLKIPTDCIGGLESKESVCSMGDPGSILGLGRSPWDGNANLLLYPCLKNSIDGGAWPVIIHAVAKSWTGLSDFTFFLFFPLNVLKTSKPPKGGVLCRSLFYLGCFRRHPGDQTHDFENLPTFRFWEETWTLNAVRYYVWHPGWKRGTLGSSEHAE